MSSILPIEIRSGRLPLNYAGSAYDFYRSVLTRLEGEVDDSKVLLGWTGGTEPYWDKGPWYRPVNPGFTLSSWWAWNIETSDYEPLDNLILNGSSVLLLSSAPTAGRVQTFPDKSGTVGLKVDVYVPRATVALTGTSIVIDGNLSNDFMQRLTGNTFVGMGNFDDGQKINYTAQNNATAYTLGFPAHVQWPGGVMPHMPSAGAGQTTAALFIFRTVHDPSGNGVVYAELAGSASASPSPNFDPGGSAPSDKGGGSGPEDKGPFL